MIYNQSKQSEFLITSLQQLRYDNTQQDTYHLRSFRLFAIVLTVAWQNKQYTISWIDTNMNTNTTACDQQNSRQKVFPLCIKTDTEVSINNRQTNVYQ